MILVDLAQFFGKKNNEQLSLFKNIGPEPLSSEFNDYTLYLSSRGRKKNIKAFIMDSSIVVGVGNIYASESLFLAGISPKRVAGKNIKKALSSAHSMY